MKKETKQKLIEFQFLEQHLKQLEQQSNIIQNQVIELKALSEALTDISKIKKGESVYIPLGSGFFIKTNMADNNEILMNVGKKTILKKSYTSAIELVENQIKELEKALPEIEKEIAKIALKAQVLHQEIQKD